MTLLLLVLLLLLLWLQTRAHILTGPPGRGKADEDAIETNAGLICGAETGIGWPGGGSPPGITGTCAGGPPATCSIVPV